MESLPYPDETSICIATFSETIHFYVMPADENAEPTIVQVSDVTDPFVPVPPSKLMFNVTEDSARLYALLDKLYNMFTEDHYSQGRQVT